MGASLTPRALVSKFLPIEWAETVITPEITIASAIACSLAAASLVIGLLRDSGSDRKDRINRVVHKYEKRMSRYEASGLDALARAEIHTLKNHNEIREATARMTTLKSPPKHPFGSHKDLLFCYDTKRIFDYVAKHHIRFAETEVEVVIEQSKARCLNKKKAEALQERKEKEELRPKD
jgi:hypothetical protein